jgi:hypothetical protein
VIRSGDQHSILGVRRLLTLTLWLLDHHARPALVRIEGRHRAGDARGAQPQILLEHDALVIDHKSHHAGIAVFRTT